MFDVLLVHQIKGTTSSWTTINLWETPGVNKERNEHENEGIRNRTIKTVQVAQEQYDPQITMLQFKLFQFYFKFGFGRARVFDAFGCRDVNLCVSIAFKAISPGSFSNQTCKIWISKFRSSKFKTKLQFSSKISFLVEWWWNKIFRNKILRAINKPSLLLISLLTFSKFSFPPASLLDR